MTPNEFEDKFNLAKDITTNIMHDPNKMQQIQEKVIELKKDDPNIENDQVLLAFISEYTRLYTDTLVYSLLKDVLVD